MNLKRLGPKVLHVEILLYTVFYTFCWPGLVNFILTGMPDQKMSIGLRDGLTAGIKRDTEEVYFK